MKNIRNARTIAVSTALVLALAGGTTVGISRAFAQQYQPAAQQQTAYEWATVGSAAEAARIAGLSLFGTPASIALGDQVYSNPTFASSGSVAQAIYEEGAIGLIVRKAGSVHQAPLTDRNESEFAASWIQDVDGISVTLWGDAQGEATVLIWKSGNAEYGVTYQGLGGEEVALDADEVTRVVRAIEDANTIRTTTPQVTPQQATPQQPAAQQAPASSEFISSNAAINAAVAFVAGDNNVSNVGASLVTGGDAPHYVVTFHFDDADYTVEVDAYTGAVWGATPTFNDGTTGKTTTPSDAATTTTTTTSSQSSSSMISSDAAISAAVGSVAGGNNVSNVGAYLVTGGDAPHYVVTFHFDDADYTVEVDAYTGAVWSATSTFNDGTSSKVTAEDDYSSSNDETKELTDDTDEATDLDAADAEYAE